MGYEDKIASIDLSNIDTIKQSTFDNLTNWSRLTITLSSNIQTIEANAFNNSDLQITLASDFNPTTILDNAFAYSQITGDLNFTNLSTLGIGAFSNTKITSINFNQLIKSGCCSKIQNIHRVTINNDIKRKNAKENNIWQIIFV